MNRWLCGFVTVLLVLFGLTGYVEPLEAKDLVRAGDRVISEADLEAGLYEELFQAEPFFEGATQTPRVQYRAVPDTFYVLETGTVLSQEDYHRREHVRQVHEMIPLLYALSVSGDVTEEQAGEFLDDSRDLFRRANQMVEQNWAAMWQRRQMYQQLIELREQGEDPEAWFREEGNAYRMFEREWYLLTRHASTDQLEYTLAEFPDGAAEYEEIVLNTSIQHYAQDRWIEQMIEEHFETRDQANPAGDNIHSRGFLDWLIEEEWLEVLDEEFGDQLKERADQQPTQPNDEQLRVDP